MPHSFGRRARTRQMFAKGFRKAGTPPLTKYLQNYKIGDIVDIKTDGSIHRGLPHKYYHGRTGVVFNVTRTSVGVEVRKAVKHRYIMKRINVRIEHLTLSRSRDAFMERVYANDDKKKLFKETGERQILKRQPATPKAGYTIEITEENKPVTMKPVKFDYNL